MRVFFVKLFHDIGVTGIFISKGSRNERLKVNKNNPLVCVLLIFFLGFKKKLHIQTNLLCWFVFVLLFVFVCFSLSFCLSLSVCLSLVFLYLWSEQKDLFHCLLFQFYHICLLMKDGSHKNSKTEQKTFYPRRRWLTLNSRVVLL